jgi:hypothetical protein
MGSGLGKNTAWRGDYDIQLADAEARRRYRLGSLRFGDFVAVVGGATRYGPSARHNYVTIGVIVHGDSTVSGHGPGVTPLLTGARNLFRLVHDSTANLAAVCGVRTPAVPALRAPLPMRDTRGHTLALTPGRRAELARRRIPTLAGQGGPLP